MSTRANFWIIKPDLDIQQYYCHFDGYLSGLGNDLRECVVKALGLNTLNKESSVYDCLMNIISKKSYNPDISNIEKEWEIEECLKQEELNKLHGDIEYLYVIDCHDKNVIKLYGKSCYDMYNSFNFSTGKYIKRYTVKEVLDDICKENSLLKLDSDLV